MADNIQLALSAVSNLDLYEDNIFSKLNLSDACYTEVSKKLTDNTYRSLKMSLTDFINNLTDHITSSINPDSFVHIDGVETIRGLKTFVLIPQCLAEPTQEHQLANKKYVDTEIRKLQDQINTLTSITIPNINSDINSIKAWKATLTPEDWEFTSFNGTSITKKVLLLN